jgi:N-methylhydantoinase B
MGNSVALELDGKWKDDFANAKVLVAHLKEGEAFALKAGGGGGFGDPFDRPAETVAEDVKQGYVSLEAARQLYGVALDPKTFTVDATATEALRKRA